MEEQNKPDTTNVKVESSTNDNGGAVSTPEKSNNFDRDRNTEGTGERFGRGGRFGGRGGGRGNQRGDGRNFENRRGGRGPRDGGRGPRQDFHQEGQEGGDGDRDRSDRGQNDRGQGDRGQGDRGQDNRGQGDNRGRYGMRGPEDYFNDRVQQLSGPTFDLPPVDMAEKKFNGRNRLYVGNIGTEVSEDELNELFKSFGETSEIFVNTQKNFGFIKLDYHCNAERAKRELDGTVFKSRNLKIRFAPNSGSVKVKNLSSMVSNELLHYAFSVFGEIERAVVTIDERGRPTGEGLVDFARKGAALQAIRRCSESCFFLTGSLRPCIVEAYDVVDDNDGYPEKNVPKKNMEFHKERDQGPRFANHGTFEHEYGMRWKQLFDLHTQKEESLKKELELEKEKLEAQMEYAKYEHETEQLREQLRAREMDKDRQKRELEMKQRLVEEEKMRSEKQMREMESRLLHQQEEQRRRQQDNSLFMQAHNLDSLLEQQEQALQAYDQPTGYSHGVVEDSPTLDPKSFMSMYEQDSGNRFEGRSSSSRGGSDNRGHWVSENRRGGEDYPTKRRRF
ncbi:unnamed protein product [Phaedon cochleariae]|uniref:RRM domain-containing protein n=1 Tax=Phaedon cochleariae TaxID=80249 RepID=A0A9P0DQF6_PHACE|nr:unnamed protein product [Phaedon cochleariae]